MDNHRIEGHSTIFSSPHHLALISLVTASSLLTLGYLLYSWWPVAPVILLLIPAWYFASLRAWNWAISLIFVMHVLAAGAGFLLEIAPIWLISGCLFALVTWDLEGQAMRYRKADRVDHQARQTVRHIRRLVFTSGSAVAVIILALNLNLALGFGLLLLLGAIAVIGLSYAVSFILRTGS